MLTRTLYNLPGWSLRNPFVELDLLRRQMDRRFEEMLQGAPPRGSVPAGVFPLINLTESQNNYRLRAELPGMKAEELDIQVLGRNVTISGERKIQSEGKDAKYHRRERESGKFSRIIGLPGDINADKVQAQLVNGVLTVTIPKSEAAKPKQIAVK
jgi:HSP20 family protein